MNSCKSICAALLTLKTGKKVEEKFSTRWNVPHALEALDGKHITIKKSKKSGTDYNNDKGFFFLVLLALVTAEYRFLWVNVGSNEYSSDAQIFNRSNLTEKIKDCTLGLPPPKPLGEEGQNLHYLMTPLP